MIDLYFWPTGNGKKIVILLEELGLPYTIKPINIGRGDQLTPEFLKISPNGRMPAIVDDEPLGGGEPLSIFESGAIMTYLAEKTGRFCPTEPRGRYEVAQWVAWQLANQGPKLGEQGHFRRALESGSNGDLSYAIHRFDNETHRIYGVMNLGLFNKRYLAAGEYTIADMICYPVGLELGEPQDRHRRVPKRAELARRNRRASGGQEGDGAGAGVPRGPEIDQPRGAGATQTAGRRPAGAGDPRGMDPRGAGVGVARRRLIPRRRCGGRRRPDRDRGAQPVLRRAARPPPWRPAARRTGQTAPRPGSAISGRRTRPR